MRAIKIGSEIKKLSPADPSVKRLFRPFIAADFVSTTDVKGNRVPAIISKSEHEWLFRNALLFGLDPKKDLNIPPVQRFQLDEGIDKRMKMQLAEYEQKRISKETRQRGREEKQVLRQLQEGIVTEEEVLEREPYKIK